jgi:hypothetical protein
MELQQTCLQAKALVPSAAVAHTLGRALDPPSAELMQLACSRLTRLGAMEACSDMHTGGEGEGEGEGAGSSANGRGRRLPGGGSSARRHPAAPPAPSAALAEAAAVQEWAKLRTEELRALLRAMGMATGGGKRELVGRLRDALDGRAPRTAATDDGEGEGEGDGGEGGGGGDHGRAYHRANRPQETAPRRPPPPPLLPVPPAQPSPGGGGGRGGSSRGGAGQGRSSSARSRSLLPGAGVSAAGDAAYAAAWAELESGRLEVTPPSGEPQWRATTLERQQLPQQPGGGAAAAASSSSFGQASSSFPRRSVGGAEPGIDAGIPSSPRRRRQRRQPGLGGGGGAAAAAGAEGGWAMDELLARACSAPMRHGHHCMRPVLPAHPAACWQAWLSVLRALSPQTSSRLPCPAAPCWTALARAHDHTRYDLSRAASVAVCLCGPRWLPHARLQSHGR